MKILLEHSYKKSASQEKIIVAMKAKLENILIGMEVKNVLAVSRHRNLRFIYFSKQYLQDPYMDPENKSEYLNFNTESKRDDKEYSECLIAIEFELSSNHTKKEIIKVFSEALSFAEDRIINLTKKSSRGEDRRFYTQYGLFKSQAINGLKHEDCQFNSEYYQSHLKLEENMTFSRDNFDKLQDAIENDIKSNGYRQMR